MFNDILNSFIDPILVINKEKNIKYVNASFEETFYVNSNLILNKNLNSIIDEDSPLILLINKGISKAVRYTGIGGLDTTFGFFFGFIKAYIISVCIFSGVHIVYNYDKWPINIDKSYAFPYLEKGSNYLIKEFPNEKTYQESREKIEEL